MTLNLLNNKYVNIYPNKSAKNLLDRPVNKKIMLIKTIVSTQRLACQIVET